MKYYYLNSTDLRTNDFVFHKYWDRPGLFLTPELQRLQCPLCKKLDQEKAIDLGLCQGDIHTRVDWFHGLDGPQCVTPKGKAALEKSGAKGLVFRPFRSLRGKDFWIVSSSVAVPTIPPDYMQFGPICSACGRYGHVASFPKLRHYVLPEDDSVVFKSSIPAEQETYAMTWLIASKVIVDRLRAARLSGFRYFAVDP